MEKQNWFGLVKLLLVIAALAVGNLVMVMDRWAPDLEAQSPCSPGGVCEGDNKKCTFPVPLPGNYCDYYPTFTCSIATCEETALEP